MYDKRAVEIMTGWLGHKNELGKKPAIYHVLRITRYLNAPAK